MNPPIRRGTYPFTVYVKRLGAKARALVRFKEPCKSRDERSGLAFQNYVRAESQVWVWLRLRLTVMDTRHYLIVFDRKSREFCADGMVDTHPKGVHSAPSRSRVNGSGNDYEVPVFVEVVQITDGSEVTALIPSFVRLYILDELEGITVDTPCYPKGNLFPKPWETSTLPSGRPVKDGELRGVRRDIDTVGTNELPCEVVQRGSEVVNAIGNECAPRQIEDRRMVGSVYVHDLIRAYFGDESVGARVVQNVEAFIESIQVHLCSVNLDFYAVKRGWLPLPTLAPTHSLSLEGDGRGPEGTGRHGYDRKKGLR